MKKITKKFGIINEQSKRELTPTQHFEQNRWHQFMKNADFSKSRIKTKQKHVIIRKEKTMNKGTKPQTRKARPSSSLRDSYRADGRTS